MKHIINKPFFEFGPKVYLYGDDALDFAMEADRISIKYGVDVIFTAQYMDISSIAKATKKIKVFAQHMDAVNPGRGVGAVLPEALIAAGAVGVLLNHAEKPLNVETISATIKRANDVGLISMVCASDYNESLAIANLHPDIILAESPLLIGKGQRTSDDKVEIKRINSGVKSVDSNIKVLHGAGIKDEHDVFEIILSGADGTGSTSGILNSADPLLMMNKMVSAVSKAWKERNNIRRK